MNSQIPKTLNPERLPANCFRTLKKCTLIALFALSTFLVNCRHNEMKQNPQNNSTTSNNSVGTVTSSDPLAIHNAAIAIDMHVDTVQRVLDEDVDLMTQLSDGHFDTIRARDGGLNAQFFSIWVEPQLFGGGG